MPSESAARAALRGRLEIRGIKPGNKIVKVRRQVKKLGKDYVFALPKNDRERTIPLSDWDIDLIRRHLAAFPPRAYTLPWEKPDGKARTCNLLFR